MTEQRNIDWTGDKYPPTANLKAVGDIIEGEVIEIGEIMLENRTAGFLHIKTSKGLRTFWLGKVLTEECEKGNIKKGDYVGIKYLGEKDSGKQSPYKNYDLRVIPAEVDGIDTGGIEG